MNSKESKFLMIFPWHLISGTNVDVSFSLTYILS